MDSTVSPPHSSTLPQFSDRLLFWALASFMIVLPLKAVGSHRFPLPLDMLCLAMMILPVFACLWAQKPPLKELLIPSAVFMLALAAMVSEAATAWSFRTGLRFISYFIFVLSISLLAPEERRNRLLRISLLGGSVVLAFSLIGYFVATLAMQRGDGPVPFIFTSSHPVFPNIPRLTGTMGTHPQNWGEYCVLLLSLAFYANGRLDDRHRRLTIISAGLASISLVFTFSQAWVGGLWIAAWFVQSRNSTRRWMKPIILSVTILTTLAITWVVNIGFPSKPGTDGQRRAVPCDQADAGHFVARAEYLDGTHLCHFTWHEWPYHHRLTTYLQAKSTAIEAIRLHPWFGTGQAGYRVFADDHFAATLGQGTTSGTNYTHPHSTWLGIPAQFGVLATISWLWLVILLFVRRPKPGQPERVLLVTVAVFLVLGLDWSIEQSIIFWTLIGWVAPPFSSARSGVTDDR